MLATLRPTFCTLSAKIDRRVASRGKINKLPLSLRRSGDGSVPPGILQQRAAKKQALPVKHQSAVGDWVKVAPLSRCESPHLTSLICFPTQHHQDIHHGVWDHIEQANMSTLYISLLSFDT